MSELNGTTPPISPDFLAILRCPQAVQEKEKYGEDAGKLELVRNSWLVSADSGYKYPIRDGIPIMLIEEGMRWKDTPVEGLPVPPPAATPADAPADSGAAACGVQPGGGFSLSPECRQRLPFMLGALIAVLAVLFFLRRRN